MSRTSKSAVRALAAAALANLLAAGSASAVTLAHHAKPAASASASGTGTAPARPAVNAGSTAVGDRGRNCTRGHLAHGHC